MAKSAKASKTPKAAKSLKAPKKEASKAMKAAAKPVKPVAVKAPAKLSAKASSKNNGPKVSAKAERVSQVGVSVAALQASTEKPAKEAKVPKVVEAKVPKVKEPKAPKVPKVKVERKTKAKLAAEKSQVDDLKKWSDYKNKYGNEKAQAYSMSSTYEAGTPLMHKVLGWGFIIQVQNDRLEVLFETGSKVLISNYKP